MARQRKSKPKLKVLFETNVLWTKSSYDLIRNEARKLIETNSQHNDLDIEWYMPSVVIREREYQMQRRAYALLPSISELEKLLGHCLNIDNNTLDRQIKEAINTQLSNLKIVTLDFDISKVDWNEIIMRSIYRLPPFEIDKEKGFRDALIAQTFMQVVHSSPVTPSVCRLAIITDDKLLTDYVKEKIAGVKNVKILSSVSELEDFINTIVSQVTEEFMSEIREKVSKYFFEKDNDDCLYYKKDIPKIIKETYSNELKTVTKEEFIRENGTWWIHNPIFVKKIKQRTHWITSIKIDAKLSKVEYSGQNITPTGMFGTSGTSATGLLQRILDDQHPSEDLGKIKPPDNLGELLSQPPDETLTLRKAYAALAEAKAKAIQAVKKVDIASGHSLFEIHWSVNITQTKKITTPKIEKVKFISTSWNEEH